MSEPQDGGGIATALAGYGAKANGGAATTTTTTASSATQQSVDRAAASTAAIAAMTGMSPEMIGAMRDMISSTVSDGIEDGVKRVVERYHLEDFATWGKASVVFQGITAAAAVGIFILLAMKYSKE